MLYLSQTSNAIVVINLNETGSFFWFNASGFDQNFLFLDLTSLSNFTWSSDTFIPQQSPQYLEDSGYLFFNHSSFISMKFDSSSNVRDLMCYIDPGSPYIFLLQFGSSPSGDFQGQQNTSFICIDMTQFCQPCPDFCSNCFGPSSDDNCLQPCSENYTWNNYSCIPPPSAQAENDDNSTHIDNISTPSSITNSTSLSSFMFITPQITFISLVALGTSTNLESLVFVLGMTDTLANLQFTNTTLGQLIYQINNNTPIYLQYCSLSYFLNQWFTVTSNYALFSEYQVPVSFTATFGFPFLVNFCTIFITQFLSRLIQTRWLKFRNGRKKCEDKTDKTSKTRRMKPINCWVPVIVYSLAKSENQILYTLVNQQNLLGTKSPHFSFLDYLDVCFVMLALVWIVGLVSFRILKSKENLSCLIFQFFQTMYILLIFFGQSMTPHTQSLTLFILTTLWVSVTILWVSIHCFQSYYLKKNKKNKSKKMNKKRTHLEKMKVKDTETPLLGDLDTQAQLFMLLNFFILTTSQTFEVSIDTLSVTVPVTLLWNQAGILILIIGNQQFLRRRLCKRKSQSHGQKEERVKDNRNSPSSGQIVTHAPMNDRLSHSPPEFSLMEQSAQTANFIQQQDEGTQEQQLQELPQDRVRKVRRTRVLKNNFTRKEQ